MTQKFEITAIGIVSNCAMFDGSESASYSGTESGRSSSAGWASNGKSATFSRYTPIRRTSSHDPGPTTLTVVVDLDHLLIFPSTSPVSISDFILTTSANTSLFVQKRPHLDQFLSSVAQIATLCLFPTAERSYVEQVRQYIDPLHTLFAMCFSRESCKAEGNEYVRDLTCIKGNPRRTVVIQPASSLAAEMPRNVVRVPDFAGDLGDKELPNLLPFITELTLATDVRSVIDQSL
jgi:Dullard-like phosphatase family protein